MNSFKDPKVLIALAITAAALFLGWNYIGAINLKNEIEQQRIVSDEKLRQAEIEQQKQADLTKIQIQKDASDAQAEQQAQKMLDEKKQTCATNAASLFDTQYKENNNNYSVHYNQRLDICYMTVTGNGTEYVATFLVDVLESKNIGLCNGSIATGEAQVCNIKGQSCSTYQECMKLIAPFMSQ